MKSKSASLSEVSDQKTVFYSKITRGIRQNNNNILNVCDYVTKVIKMRSVLKC